MRRSYEKSLKNWFTGHDRKPLILRGARQVGKSTLVRIFCENEGVDLIEINLEINKFKSLMKDTFSIEDWLLEVEAISGKRVSANTILFLDEIQAQPKAISCLRYFYELKNDIPVLAAGSLLEIVLHNEEISFPVGRVSFLWISPMSFEEYLLAIGRDDLYEKLVSGQTNEYTHDVLNEEVKKYFFIGGMPNVIKTFIETKSFLEARKIQIEILEAYRNDFPKYSKRLNLDRLTTVFQSIPFYLGKKLIYSKLDPSSKSSEIKKMVELLIRANIIIPSYHSSLSGLPLRSGIDQSVMKPFFLDIGLVNCIHEFNWVDFETLYDESFSTKGFLAEQFVSQHISYTSEGITPPESIFWLKDKDSKKAEVDFIKSDNGKILPIEVKAAKGKRLKSLILLCEYKKINKALKISREPRSLREIELSDFNLEVENIPFYEVARIMDQSRS